MLHLVESFTVESGSPRALTHIVDALLEFPWAIRPSKLSAIVDVVTRRMGGDSLSASDLAQYDSPKPQTLAAPLAAAPPSGGRGGIVAVLPLMGVIMPRVGLLEAMSGAQGLIDFRQQFRGLVRDPDVTAIVLDVDSPGGSVSGVPEMAEEIRAARGKKRVWAVADPTAASAAFWLATQAERFVVTPSGMVGSVGVIAAHEDLSRALEIKGITTTLITSSPFKAEGNPYEPLSDEARAEIQRVVDSYHGDFERALAAGRGVSVAHVRANFGQGRMARASEAVDARMADAVGTLDDVLAELGARPRGEARAMQDAPHVEAREASVAIDAEELGAALAVALERSAGNG